MTHLSRVFIVGPFSFRFPVLRLMTCLNWILHTLTLMAWRNFLTAPMGHWLYSQTQVNNHLWIARPLAYNDHHIEKEILKLVDSKQRPPVFLGPQGWSLFDCILVHWSLKNKKNDFSFLFQICWDDERSDGKFFSSGFHFSSLKAFRTRRISRGPAEELLLQVEHQSGREPWEEVRWEGPDHEHLHRSCH